MGLVIKAFFHGRGDPGLAEAGFARDQDDLAVPRFSAFPSVHEQVNLVITANQPGQSWPTQGLEPARDGAWAQHLPGRHGPGDALQLDSAKIAIFEKISNQSVRRSSDRDRVRRIKVMKKSCKVRAID